MHEHWIRSKWIRVLGEAEGRESLTRGPLHQA